MADVHVCMFVLSEVLLVLPSLGVQVKTMYWFGRQETHFFDKSHVKGIVINEAITMVSTGLFLMESHFCDASHAIVKDIAIKENSCPSVYVIP